MARKTTARAAGQTPLSRDLGLKLYRDLVRIRSFEERVRGLAAAGQVPGLVHLYSGQEAVAVGVSNALRPDDYIASHHRGHGHCLARGADPETLFAEIMGKAEGYGMGRGGSLHIYDPENRNLGTNGIVGGGVPLATGAALSARTLGQDFVAVAFFGDGAMNQGIVLECMNMAAIGSLPVVFVCENNHYGEFTRIDDVTAGSLGGRGEAFAIPTVELDGMDPVAVHEAATTAVDRARGGGGPSFLICDTWRYSGHHVGDKQDYKDDAEAKAWFEKDPIVTLGRRLVAARLIKQAELDALGSKIEVEIGAAADAARAKPDADPQTLTERLYA